MARKSGKFFTAQPPDLDNYTGRDLRDFLRDISRWLRSFASFAGEPGAMKDRFIAVTSGTITANAGLSGPLGSGNVTYKRIIDDDELESNDTIEVFSIMLTTIATGKLVIVERIEGKYVITAVVC